MKNKSEIQNPKSQILIVGAGPAGASLAIRLAEKGFEIVLVERDKFPRQKLCGEFVSPECLTYFRELNVLDEMFAIGGDRISETVFYAPNGKNVSVSSKWFNAEAQNALSISRAEMDFRLIEKAKRSGVKVLEETQIVGILYEDKKVCGVKAKNKSGETFEITSNLTIDATGRANVLGKLAEKARRGEEEKRRKGEKIRNPKSQIRNRLVGFKTHLKNVNLEKGRCEIYFFRGGYGGLSFVENGSANHCFLIKADVVKEFGGKAEKIVEDVIFENKRAFETMKDAENVFDWLAVSVESFGRKELNPAPNLFAVGDAAAFIDPFTGSGMLMAMQSAKILAEIVSENRFSFAEIAEKYKLAHKENFQNRLRVCALMRRAAFLPNLAKLLISTLSFSEKSLEFLARATRQSVLFDKNK
ncbi:MAG TPA: NAD(P)/FAD-dependent oxidoreductase [Pyrinomonadaceae bacterium]|nr:NAD(P)/FAD-dependent oxidoreductase [Pyrinomonadaceae bacterium]